ncbi:hypothetical protein [Haladaptatus sp. W1]|uniref:hypothetical protein n=1 Tax=Haladaptatus sp. W1 TaxID=1897478 RepID=UPI001C30C482|nr:hypothetical protein [Haladaptatus sp. W1]
MIPSLAILGLPVDMFVVFIATIIVGSIGAIHYLIVHVLGGKPFEEIDHQDKQTSEVSQ